MAIAFRTAQSSGNIGGAPVQDAFTTVTGDTHLVVGVSPQGAAGTVTGVTFNSVAMTSIGSVTQSSYTLYLFALISPDIGTYNIVFSLSGATNICYAAAAYTGAPTTLNLAAFASNSTASGASLSTSNTAPTGWNILVARSNKGGGSTMVASTGSTMRSLTTAGELSIGIFDSNAVVSGSQSMDVTATASSIILGGIATLSNTSVTIEDTNATTDSITGTGNVWFFTQSDTNVTTDSPQAKYGFGNDDKSSSPAWVTEPKS